MSEAMDEVKTEFPKYFDALQKHPRLLVGEEVPSVKGEGMEVLHDSSDAREWQEAVKQTLTEEAKHRAESKKQELKPTMDTLYASIDIFRNNADLVPGAKQFDKELADRFAGFVKDYEVRVDGKLIGYALPVQPLINNIRTQLATERQSRKQAAPPPQEKAPEKKPAPKPQRGIPSQASSGAPEPEGFSTLFGTLGLPDLVI